MDTLPWKKKQRERGRTKHALIGMNSKINPESGKIHVDGYATHHAGAGVTLRYNLSHNTRHRISQSRLHCEVGGLPWCWICLSPGVPNRVR